jgi:phosphoribosyl 1,2-cyclic phosphodiesterase
MKIITLQSGSNGNCFYLEAGQVRLLFDAGITGRQAELRLTEHGRDIRQVDALFISHDHSDHARYLGVFQRKFGIPVYLTEKTLAAAGRSANLGQLNDIRLFQAGSSIAFGDVIVHSIPTPHDSAEGVAFVIEHGTSRVGILTDLGHVFDGLREVLLSLDAVIIESNYDASMLEYGPYPEYLKRRIRGSGGHLSNDESAQLIAETLRSESPKLKWACLCHLSEHNNEPEVARRAHHSLLGEDFPVHIAERYRASKELEI